MFILGDKEYKYMHTSNCVACNKKATSYHGTIFHPDNLQTINAGWCNEHEHLSGAYFDKTAYYNLGLWRPEMGLQETEVSGNLIALDSEDEIKSKAKKWDELWDEISPFYLDKDGEYSEDDPEEEGDLCTIGEIAARKLGLM